MIYAIGDIHGCYDQLLVLLAKIKAHAGARPYRGIFLGDYVDRGPNSRAVVNQIRGLVTSGSGYGTWQALKGNHEDMMIRYLAGRGVPGEWQVNGAPETLASYSGYTREMNEHAAWLSKLPTMIETENHIFVHAGLSPRFPIAEQPEEVKLWIRNWQYADPNFGKHVVYGHSPKKAPNLLEHSSGLDTGACFGGALTAGVFDPATATGPFALLQAP